MKKGNRPSVIVIAGPTSSGKSTLAIRMARKLNGEIISADSRQVYRGMDIGTGKVTKREQRLARHWMLDVASPKRQYTAARWKASAERAIRDIVRRGKIPIICGGTGFYIDILIYQNILPAVKPDAKLRKRFDKLTADQLFELLRKLDPRRATTIDRHNPVRLVRALEIVLTTGSPVPAPRHDPPYDVLYLVLDPSKEQLARRIAKRLDARLKSGMLREVRRLYRSGVSYRRLESFGLEYRWLARYLQALKVQPLNSLRLNLGKEMRDGLLRDIIAYSKHQMTWWRRNSDVQYIIPTSPAKVFRQVADWLCLSTVS